MQLRNKNALYKKLALIVFSCISWGKLLILTLQQSVLVSYQISFLSIMKDLTIKGWIWIDSLVVWSYLGQGKHSYLWPASVQASPDRKQTHNVTGLHWAYHGCHSVPLTVASRDRETLQTMSHITSHFLSENVLRKTHAGRELGHHQRHVTSGL